MSVYTHTHTHTHTHIYIYIYNFFVIGPKREYEYFKMSIRRNLYFLGFIYSFCSYIRACFQLDVFVREHVWHKA